MLLPNNSTPLLCIFPPPPRSYQSTEPSTIPYPIAPAHASMAHSQIQPLHPFMTRLTTNTTTGTGGSLMSYILTYPAKLSPEEGGKRTLYVECL